MMRKVDIRNHQFIRISGVDDVGIRPATRLEMGRLMGLPDGFLLPASVAGTAKVCGDGVAVPEIEWLLTHLLEPLLNAADSSTMDEHSMVGAEADARPRSSGTATTVHFQPGELDRMRRYAAEGGRFAARGHVRGMDRNVAEVGAAPVRRSSPAAAVPRAKWPAAESSGSPT